MHVTIGLRQALTTVAMVTAVAFLLAGCGSGGSTTTATIPGAAETGGGDTGQVERPSTPLTAAGYSKLLADELAGLRTAILRIDDARRYQGLLDRARSAQRKTAAAAETLGAATPPEQVAAEHEQLVAALRTLAANLNSTAGAIEARSLCAAPSVTARLSQLKAGDALRSARAGLEAAGFEVPALLPRPRATPDRRLPTGTVLVQTIGSGPGELTIENGLSVDGVVALVPPKSKTPVLSFFVRARDSHAIARIGDGRYRVYFTAGRDWDEKLGAFTRKCDFSEFDDPLVYETRYDSGHYHYSVWTLTLNPVIGGTASTSPVDPGEFPAVG